jgi:glycosyl transferase, family 25
MSLRTGVGALTTEDATVLARAAAFSAAPVAASPRAVAAAVRAALPAFFINRDRDRERLKAIKAELATAEIEADRIAGVEGVAVPPHMRPQFFDGDRPYGRLDPGEIGCYASHLKVLELVVARGLSHALIVEDDALLPSDLVRRIDRILASLPPNWDFVHLCNDPCRAVKTVARLDQSHALVRYSRVPANTVGYLISQAGARKFLVPCKRMWPVDTDFRRPWQFGLEVYGVAPKIIGTNAVLPPAITSRSRSRRGIPIPTLDCLSGNPLHSAHGALFNIRRLGLSQWAACLAQNTLRRTLRMLHVDAILRYRARSLARG